MSNETILVYIFLTLFGVCSVLGIVSIYKNKRRKKSKLVQDHLQTRSALLSANHEQQVRQPRIQSQDTRRPKMRGDNVITSQTSRRPMKRGGIMSPVQVILDDDVLSFPRCNRCWSGNSSNNPLIIQRRSTGYYCTHCDHDFDGRVTPMNI